MKVELILNPEVEGYEQIQHELRQELSALKRTKYTEVSEPAPPRVLSVEHDVVKFVFEHPGDAFTMARGLVELAMAVLERLNVRAGKEQLPVIILVKNKTLSLPSPQSRVKRFLDWIRKGEPEKSPTKKPPRKKKQTKTSR